MAAITHNCNYSNVNVFVRSIISEGHSGAPNPYTVRKLFNSNLLDPILLICIQN